MSMSKLREKLAAKKKAIKASSGQRADVIRAPMGKHKFRILPAHPKSSKGEDALPYADFGLHYIKSEEKDEKSGRNKMKAVYVCTHHTFGRECEVCAAIEEAARHATTDEQLDLIDDAKCNRAEVLVNVLHLSSTDKAGTPQILQLTPTTFEQVISIWEEYQEEGIDIFDPENGVDLSITREGAGLNTKYTVMASPAKAKPVPAGVLDAMQDLDEFVQQEHEEGLRKALSAVNATVGLLTADRAPKAAAIEHKSGTASVIDDDDMMSVMDDDLGIEDADIAELVEAEVKEVKAEAKKTGTDDAPVDSGSDLDDIDDLLADLDDL